MNERILAIFAAPALGILFYGFLLGLKHATEADHLAAVSTIVTRRTSLWSSALVGGLWGLGHTMSLVAAGVFVLLLNFQIGESTERYLELGVGVMLALLGLNVIRRLLSGEQLHLHQHEHGDNHLHAHPHLHDSSEVDEPRSHHGLSFTPRAFFIGMVHGLAGSAALMLLIIPTIESRALGLLYVAVFGIGSIGGMMLMSFLVGLPFLLVATRSIRVYQLMQATAGIISIGLGFWIVYENGFARN